MERKARCLLLLATLCGSLILSCSARQALQVPPPLPVAVEEKFVEIRDGGFVMGCNKFKVAGWNQWEVVEAAAGAPSLSGASIPVGTTGPQLVRALLERGSAMGLNVMRTWAHAVNPQYALQTAPGVYNEATFQGLDYMIDQARVHGVKLILAFTSNWTPTGGIPEYVKWAGLTENTAFFTSPEVKNMYKEFVTAIVNRVNTINGRVYRDDPTIMAWNLLNEPRCEGCAPGTIAAWYDEMATFVKALDPNHLVSTGSEGFYGCCNAPANPGVQWSEWASGTGQDFLLDNASPAIDFATMHSWPDNWQDVTPEFQRLWISQHADDAAKVLQKPLLMEEWGKWVNETANAPLADRSAFMTAAFDEIEKLVAADSALQGSAFWQWYLEGQEAAPTEGGGRGLFGIYETDEAFELIRNNADFIASVNAPIAGCTPAQHRAVAVGPASDCSQTWVNGIPETGMEGETCDIPINECVRGTAGCDANAACIDTPTGFECRCYWGYAGKGTTCAPTPSLEELKAAYFSQPMGQSCDEGAPVPWPAYSPGFVYDPMNSLTFWDAGDGKQGSPTNVTLEQCMIACQMEPICESFVYNDVQQKCFLANGQCPVYNSCVGEETICNSTNDRGGQFQFGCGYWISYYRLDMDVAAACATFLPDPTIASTAQPQVVPDFEAFKAAVPGGRFGAGPPPPPAPPALPAADVAVLPASAGR